MDLGSILAGLGMSNQQMPQGQVGPNGLNPIMAQQTPPQQMQMQMPQRQMPMPQMPMQGGSAISPEMMEAAKKENPFEGIGRMLDEVERDPEGSEVKFRFLAKNGMKPPEFYDGPSLIRTVEDMIAKMSQSTSNAPGSGGTIPTSNTPMSRGY